jgi:hypothetical protein
MNSVLSDIAKIVGRAWARAWLEKLHEVEASDKRGVHSNKSGDASQPSELNQPPFEREESADTR